MAWTTTDRDALKAAIARGEQSVRYADREVTYRSIAEMLQALAKIEAEIDAAAATTRPRQYYGVSSKGV